MKQGNLEKWTNMDQCQNLLFFSELVNELLFDYSIPSNRVSTLNSHYLCLDALSAIDGIENHGVPEGTLKPIVAELFIAIQKDPIFAETSESPLKYFIKYQNDRPRVSTNISELNYFELNKAVISIRSRFFTGNNYYKELRDRISDIIVNNRMDSQISLFRLTKSLLTELINLGYSQRYIYNVMNTLYWNPSKEIDSPNIINDFFESFNFEKKEYDVVFVVNKTQMQRFMRQIDYLSFLDEFTPRTSQHEEIAFLNKNKSQAYLVIKRKAYDPFKAADAAKRLISDNTAFYRLCDHEYNYDIRMAKCAVYDNNTFYRISQSKSAVSHTKMPSDEQITESMTAAEKALDSVSRKHSFQDYFALINAATFHSQSLDSTSPQNQLLDLWAIFESILDISNAHTSERITQICMYLVPILKRKYIFSLFEQLASDIKNYSETEYYKIIEQSQDNSESIQRVCEFVLLDARRTDRESFLENCSDFPLLKERIVYYNEKIGKPINAYHFVEKHADYVRWQIMRIYRNRNLIIHNGETMPYLSLLIENLHAYVDEFFSYLIHSLSNGHNVDSMCQELFSKECDWIADFTNKKAIMSPEMIQKMLAI